MKKIKQQFKMPGIEYWPEVRWWLAEGSHTDETLRNEIQMLYNFGFGAVEFLAMPDNGVDTTLYGWGAEEWIHDTRIVLEEVTKRGMGASMTSGANWSNANLPTISPDDKASSKELDFTCETIQAGQQRTGELRQPEFVKTNVHKNEFVAAIAAKRLSETDGVIQIDEKTIIDISSEVVAGKLDWTAPTDGEYELVVLWMHGTGQTAEPSAKTSYTINYMDKYGSEAWIEYWDKEVLSPQLKELIRKNKRIQIYMDSLEITTYGKGYVIWAYSMLDEFKKRHGYDLKPYLPFVLRKCGDHLPMNCNLKYWYEMQDRELAKRIRTDLYQTMTDLYMENVLLPLQSWLHKQAMTLRAEISYGMTFEISQPGKYVDGIETESLEFASQIDSFRGMAGSAHIYNRIYSSETGASLQNYKEGLDFYTQIIYTQFASGVVRTVLHGHSSIAGSEKATYWPGHEGMMPMFSERFGSRQPASQHYKDWSDMIARYQYVLRQGKPRMDIGILRLDYYFNNILLMLDEVDTYHNRWMRKNEGIYWKDTTLQNAGYAYDYFAPQLLNDVHFKNGELAPDGPGYRALIIYQESIPYESAERVLEMVKEGLSVVLANGITESVRLGLDITHKKAACKTPYNDGADGRLAEVIAELKTLPNVKEINDPKDALRALQSLGVYPRVSFAESNRNLLPLLREDGEMKYLYLYNCMTREQNPVYAELAIDGEGKPYALDCWTGEIEGIAKYRHEDRKTFLEVTLHPGEAKLFALNTAEKEDIFVVDSNASVIRKKINEFSIVAYESGEYQMVFNNDRVLTENVEVPENIPLKKWKLVVEDWNEGERKIIEEDRGLGYVTREVYYDTKKDRITVGETELVSWKDIPAVGPAVSGIGHYTTTIKLPESWNEDDGARLKIGSSNGNIAVVYVNDQKAGPVDFNNSSLDITSFLKSGVNTILIEISSSLNNRMMQRGYFDITIHESMKSPGNEIVTTAITNDEGCYDLDYIPATVTHVRDYGITGTAELLIYKKRRLQL